MHLIENSGAMREIQRSALAVTLDLNNDKAKAPESAGDADAWPRRRKPDNDPAAGAAAGSSGADGPTAAAGGTNQSQEQQHQHQDEPRGAQVRPQPDLALLGGNGPRAVEGSHMARDKVQGATPQGVRVRKKHMKQPSLFPPSIECVCVCVSTSSTP